jgi:hypothetical protein
MTIIATVVIVPDASNESEALDKAEEILEISAVNPYGEGEINDFGRWESFAPGWLDYGMPTSKVTGEEAEALQVKEFDLNEFFRETDDEPDFTPEALVLADGSWTDGETIEPAADWKEYFMTKVLALPDEAWLVFVEADC